MKNTFKSSKKQNIFKDKKNANQDTIAEHCYKLGVDADCRGNCPLAINLYTKSIEITPCPVLAYINRGAMYAESGNYKKAIADFTKAIQLAPNFGAAYYHRGLAYKKIKKNKQSNSDFIKACYLKNEYCKQ